MAPTGTILGSGSDTVLEVAASEAPASFSVSLTIGSGGCEDVAFAVIDLYDDVPVLQEVPGLTVTKVAGDSVLISFDDIGGLGYDLHRVASPDELEGSTAVAFQPAGSSTFVDTPPAGVMAYYSVRDASSCSLLFGPP